MYIERLSADDYAPQKELVYEDVLGLHPIYDKLAFRANLCLVGPKGVAKSTSVADYAAKIDCPIVTFDCSEDVRRAHLIGKFILRGGDTPFILGPVTTAFEIANEVGQCILDLEELNGLSPQMQKTLNPALDFRRRVEVPEAKRVFQLREGARLWVVATMNMSGYGGVYSLNEDLTSRFRILALDYPSPEKERLVVDRVAASELEVIPEAKDVVTKVLTLAHETRQQAFEYALATRDVIQIIEDIASMGLAQALTISLGKFEDEDRKTYKQRISSIFGIRLGW